MKEPKHKGTEFSNINEVWDQNEKHRAMGDEIIDKGNEFSNVSQVWEENEKKEGGPEKDDKDSQDDYWDRITEDAASGYRSEEDENEILNKNQKSKGRSDDESE